MKLSWNIACWLCWGLVLPGLLLWQVPDSLLETRAGPLYALWAFLCGSAALSAMYCRKKNQDAWHWRAGWILVVCALAVGGVVCAAGRSLPVGGREGGVVGGLVVAGLTVLCVGVLGALWIHAVRQSGVLGR